MSEFGVIFKRINQFYVTQKYITQRYPTHNISNICDFLNTLLMGEFFHSLKLKTLTL